MKEMLLVMFIVQFVIQFFAYRQARILLYWLAGPVLYDTFKLSAEQAGQGMMYGAIALNIAISLFVRFLTSSGALAGTSNLFASVLLGFVMAYDVYKFKKVLIKHEESKVC